VCPHEDIRYDVPVHHPTRTPDEPDPRLAFDPHVHQGVFHFPPGFLWGAATSAHQVEGDNTHNDWWAWEQAGHVPWRSGLACDHYRRYREDFDLARSISHNAHRFSLEWSRIEPRPGEYSDEALAHYSDVIDALRSRGMEPVMTIHHFTLPLWLAEQGGWEARGVEDRFVRLVDQVARAYGTRVRWWITLNEPVVLAFKGYVIGQWPPGVQSLPRAMKVIRRLLRAHVLAYDVIHHHRPDAMVSVATHALAVSPCNPRRLLDLVSAAARHYLFNQMFLKALLDGSLWLPGQFFERLPMKRSLDFIGLNYYTRDFVHNTGLDLAGLIGNRCGLDPHERVGKRTSLGWEIYPEGLLEFLKIDARFRLPLLITENGIATDVEDDRLLFLMLHVWQVARALGLRLDVRGYLYWSLLDNFEWADGFQNAHFGLIGVDFATQQRTVRHSAVRFAEVIAANQL
jgi:beta-glucosidase